jgi:hypothetical protein
MQPTHTLVAPAPAAATVPRTLRDAAAYLARHGWIQGAYYDSDASGSNPAACTVGAIAMVCYGGPQPAPALMFDKPGYLEFEAAVSYLDATLRDECDQESVYTWNDDRARTLKDVLQVLVEVAECCEGDSTLDGARGARTPSTSC